MRSDYRERSFASKNKPRRQPVGKYAAALLGIVLFIFASGFAGGWLSCLYRIKKSASLQPALVGTLTAKPSQAVQPMCKLPPNGQQPPLTFYETLPKGGKGVIGSGINANLNDHAVPSVVKAPLAQPASATTKPPAAVVTEIKVAPAIIQNKNISVLPEGERKFAVQVASVKEKAEAESLRSKLAAKGMNPTIIEVKIPEKGVVFRVRAGRHMLQREAQELAIKLGSGAIVTSE